MSQPWTESIIAVKQSHDYILTKLTGNDGDYGIVTIPWKELCTVTYITKGEVIVVNEQGKQLCKLGPGRFHYSYINEDTLSKYDDKDGASVFPVDEMLGTVEEMHQVAAQEKIKLVSVGETEFYCLSDPNYNRIWTGSLYTVNETDKIFSFSPEPLSYIIPLDDTVCINNMISRKHRAFYTNVLDQDFTVSGYIGDKFIAFSHAGFIEHQTNSKDRK